MGVAHIAQFKENNVYGTLNHVVILALFGLHKIRRLICVLLKKLSLSDIYCSISLHVGTEVIFPDSSFFFYERNHFSSLKAARLSILRLQRHFCAVLCWKRASMREDLAE